MIDRHALTGKHIKHINMYCMSNTYKACYTRNTYMLHIYDEEFITTKEFST